MPTRRRGPAKLEFSTLFAAGAIGGLTDGELLDRFARGGGAAEPAFAALMGRHGPMVLRVCRSILGDDHAAEDALQATFLILVHRASSVRRPDSLASWLHGVALRVAGCARRAGLRRRVHEERAAAAREARCGPGEDPDLAPILHEELGRLPDRYRSALVLCHLEGLTCEEAGRRLGWPSGTVKSRLARGRERLRGRLARRGLAPSAGVAGLMASGGIASAALPPTLAESTTRVALLFAAGRGIGPGSIPPPVAALTGRFFMLMGLNKLACSAAAALLLAAAAGGVSVLAWGRPADPAAGSQAPAAGDPPVKAGPVLEGALAAAEAIDVPWMKAQALADIAATLARSGRAEASRATFSRASGIVDGLGDDPFGRAANLCWLAKARAEAGDRDGARAAVAGLLAWAAKVDEGRRHTLLEVATMRMASAGDACGAGPDPIPLNEAAPYARAAALIEAAGSQAKAGDLRDARATMALADAEGKAGRTDERAAPEGEAPAPLDAARLAEVRGLAPLAVAEAKAGQVDAARATLRRAREVADRIGLQSRPAALAEVAMALRAAGDRGGSDATLGLALGEAEGLAPAGPKAEALAMISMAQADSGDRAAARKTLRRAILAAEAGPAFKDGLRQVLSAASMRAGDWEGGRAAILALDDRILRASQIEALALGQAKSGEARAALAWAEAQEDALMRAHALLGVARGIAER